MFQWPYLYGWWRGGRGAGEGGGGGGQKMWLKLPVFLHEVQVVGEKGLVLFNDI